MKFEFKAKPKKLVIDSESVDTAIAKAGDEYILTHVDGKQVIGKCERTGVVIVDGDNYLSDTTGLLYCDSII